MSSGSNRPAAFATQPSTLLPALFENIEQGQRLTVLHIGPARPESVELFSRYRCKLHFVDLFEHIEDLAVSDPPSEHGALENGTTSLQDVCKELIDVPRPTRFDVCLFWDLLNFLNRDAIRALLDSLRPHLHGNTLGHGFAVHNLKTAQSGKVYSISDIDQISVRPRLATLPRYSPYTQGQLEKVLDYFTVARSVLLAESRLELLLTAKLPG